MKAILVLNAGSSSLKFKVFVKNELGFSTISSGQFSSTNSAQPKFKIKINQREFIQEFKEQISMPQMLDLLHQAFTQYLPEVEIEAIGHRVVHGGDLFTDPTLVNQEVIDSLKSIIYLTPIHLPHNIAPMEVCMQIFKDVPQVACFDTAFHSTIDSLRSTYAIPRELTEKDKIRRYGFHGLSYEYLIKRLYELAPTLANGKVIMAHLGAGASITALNNKKSVDTTMGLTPLEGLVMATRSGSIDPAIVLYLMKQGYSYQEIEHILYFKSGLLGISGTTADWQAITKSNQPNDIEAFHLFVNSVSKNMLALTSGLQGVDAIVFAGGIGENSAVLRKAVLDNLSWLGITLSNEANETAGAHKETLITGEDSKIKVFVIPTEEELTIAKHVVNTLR